MSIRVDEFQLKIDEVNHNNVLKNYLDKDDNSYYESFKNGYYPINENRDYITDNEIVERIMKDFPNSEIFFRIVTDYGEEAYKGKNGKVTRLQKVWIDPIINSPKEK